ncbi:MAG: cell division protein FtsZ [Chloroflexota bacterium]|nr:cell division protein FtsZ [Chloroflexota bacterium]
MGVMGKMDFSSYLAKIKIVGAGGGGCNAVNRMVQKGIQGVEFIAVNTDVQDLENSLAPKRIQIGPKLTRGLGVGGDHEVGRRAAAESAEELQAAIADTDLLFITAGMGGGTGTGAASTVAEISKEAGILTIGIVTKPFTFEGSVRREKAEDGIDALVNSVDTLITIRNDRLLSICDCRVSVNDAFLLADEILYNGVQSISELITVPGLINLDFADVKTIMTNAGQSWMGIGKGSGPNRAVDAAKAAISSPLLDTSMEGAKGVLLNVTGGSTMSISEVNDAAEIVRQSVDAKANIIFGVAQDDSMGDDVRVTLIATGFAGAMTSEPKEEEMRQILKELKEEDKLDTPTFLRHPLPQRRRQAMAFSSEVKAEKAAVN